MQLLVNVLPHHNATGDLSYRMTNKFDLNEKDEKKKKITELPHHRLFHRAITKKVYLAERPHFRERVPSDLDIAVISRWRCSLSRT